MAKENEFKFEMSLSVLNHLGRNLYRNFITVLGEAVSNAWDADAQNVRIYVSQEHRSMTIIDDGIGMNNKDFQDKFLTVGYSKREDGAFQTLSGRPYIGRKGIGKLALLSCSEKVHIASRTKDNNIIGGVVDNSLLDKSIRDGHKIGKSGEYTLDTLSDETQGLLAKYVHGTVIYFENLIMDKMNSLEFIKKSLALYFQFSILDPKFRLFVNDEEIVLAHLNDFINQTEIIWNINNFSSAFYSAAKNSENKISEYNVATVLDGLSGFIATANKPSSLKIHGLDGERATIDLYVNGRLREKDLLKHFPTTRIVESYAYGQIHYNALDADPKDDDAFTSNREGILLTDPRSKKLIEELEKIFRKLMDDWDEVRVSKRLSGDPLGKAISTLQERKARELYNEIAKDDLGLAKPKGKKVVEGANAEKIDRWASELEVEAGFNLQAYTRCFQSENLLRRLIAETGRPLTKKEIDRVSDLKKKERVAKEDAKITFEIRKLNNDLSYLEMSDFENITHDKIERTKTIGITFSAKVYKPLRDAVAHTSILTDFAKNRLEAEYGTIKEIVKTKLDCYKKECETKAAQTFKQGMQNNMFDEEILSESK